MADCEHKFVYRGVVYSVQDHKIPGSGGQEVYYYDFYFCERCLDKKYDRLPYTSNSYDAIRLQAMPKGIG